MSAIQIIDTFPTFLSFWPAAAGKEIDQQIERWHADYISKWPELSQKVIKDYDDQDMQ